MNNEFSLSSIRRRLNNGECLVLTYINEKNHDGKHWGWLIDINNPDDCGEYGYIEDIIMSDRKELLKFLSIYDYYGLMLKKEGNDIKSFLVHTYYRDSNNIKFVYYDLPFLDASHERLKTSLYKLNEEIRKLNISRELSRVVNSDKPNVTFRKHFSFKLEEDKKTLKLIKRNVKR